MSSKLSVEEVLSNLAERAAFHRDQEALHSQQEVHHREQRALHAAELEKVQQSLEAFRTVAESAVELARPVTREPRKPAPALAAEEEALPPPGRLMVGRLLQRIVEARPPAAAFGATTIAAEANRRFADRLPGPVSPRTASAVLRRMLAEGAIKLAREGKAFHEAMYTRRSQRPSG